MKISLSFFRRFSATIFSKKLHLDIDFPYYPVKHDDGEIYIHWPTNDIKFKYEIEKVTLAAEKIYLGKDDITPLVVTYFNSNWRTLLDRFGKNLIDTATNNYLKYGGKFFDNVPASKYLTDDLTPYL